MPPEDTRVKVAIVSGLPHGYAGIATEREMGISLSSAGYRPAVFANRLHGDGSVDPDTISTRLDSAFDPPLPPELRKRNGYGILRKRLPPDVIVLSVKDDVLKAYATLAEYGRPVVVADHGNEGNPGTVPSDQFIRMNGEGSLVELTDAIERALR